MKMLKEEKELRDELRRLGRPLGEKCSWDPNYVKKQSRLITALIRAVRADEREKCAKVAEDSQYPQEIEEDYNSVCRNIAAAIREGKK